MSVLRLIGVRKSFGATSVLKGVDLALERGASCALLGRSGSGKTTLARIICGLERPEQGDVVFGADCSSMLIPQDFVIWPHLTVAKNVAPGFRGAKSEKGNVIAFWLNRLGLDSLAVKPAGTLSFGQQQRVSFARAFCFSPQLMVLDEPLAHVDTPARGGLVAEVRRLCSEAGIAMLWITHDAHEAFAAADQVAALQDGRIVQHATPETLYCEPATREVADLTGEMSWLEQADWECLARHQPQARTISILDGKKIGFRPEWLEIVERSNSGCLLVRRNFVGAGYIYVAQLPSGALLKVFHREHLPLGESRQLRILSEPCML